MATLYPSNDLGTAGNIRALAKWRVPGTPPAAGTVPCEASTSSHTYSYVTRERSDVCSVLYTIVLVVL
jgi:hypothetical protein